jgi:hypothetical protein
MLPEFRSPLVNIAHLPKLNDCRGREASSWLPFDGRGMVGPRRFEGTTERRWGSSMTHVNILRRGEDEI